MTSSDVSAAELYDHRCEQFARERDRLASQSARVSNLRLLAFTAAAVLLGWALWTESLELGAGAAGLLGGFVVLVRRHRRLERDRRRYDGLWRINHEARLRLARAWDELPVRHAARADPDHPYAADLNLFGRASLFHLMETVGSRMGEETLGRWLLRFAEPETVRERQRAVAELTPLVDFRDELQLRGRATTSGPEHARPDPAQFLAWAESTPWLTDRRGLVWAARVSPVLLGVSILAQVTGLVSYPLWIVFMVANLVLGWALLGRASRILAQVSSIESALRTYADAFALLSETGLAAPALRRIQTELSTEGVSAAAHAHRLHWLASLAFPSSTMVSGLVQTMTLWDVHVLALLERWQVAVGPRARGWLAALGEAEALAALAQLAHDNPGWAFPQLDPKADIVHARGLGHPLLAADARVDNDLSVGPPGTFLLVTGSNMSGKSTLLRAVGVNAVLAGAGGPVCARELRMPPLALWTSMRIQDSLERGVSYFMAELQRLKQIVDAAADARSDGAEPRPMLYLLDEILQGTNTTDRQVAARRIIRLLIERGALGAVSTHDLTLADTPALAPATRAIHLTETISDDRDGPQMSFDYKIRPGVATSANALRLLELVGLPSA